MSLLDETHAAEVQQGNGIALFPLVIFLVLFIGTGSVLMLSGVSMAFYQLSATVAVIPGIMAALWMGKESFDEKVTIFLKGAGDINIMTMCVIYLLAGGFAAVAKAVGGVDATVNMGLSLVPASLVLPGLFVIAAFVATAMGTSMGTIAAIGPIAAGVASHSDMSIALLMGAVVGGAMFGDNLSMISDTTIAATRTQGCNMRDKFRMNLMIALPAALITIVLYAICGSTGTVANVGEWQFFKVLPYLVILGMAVAGVNVFIVLTTGIIFAGGVGIASLPDFSLLTFSKEIYSGFVGMHEILVLSILVGGLGELIRHNGGLTWLVSKIGEIAKRFSKTEESKKAGEFSIAALAALADGCIANNTVAIILSGGMAKEIAKRSGISAKRSASLLDIFSCVVQGLVPYAAQVLLAGSLAKVSPVDVAASNWYCLILAFAGSAAIYFGKPTEQ
ncbi:Na+/H+ antiporter NhaC family protein [Halodesulfovibrio sp.]|jgi:Na+/H+ antiporter NhaC|uniref:Na+/H+ antiporter NhaC family protein n=1 Tax=Halodesulfovibrio sp. TaxID=1912772 RepID=UPI0025F8A626|nr:Na+/H+ antiporter NhaC family protein [Halodesulfovibrio sp.]MCT4535857.1 Na+/H+ antiporter NhaC family protein [Halodesulfovibrio sp.]MCT4626507.1 Na+/H+ antiporter NhaC family protein [Halodesulfovibrio sp.]